MTRHLPLSLLGMALIWAGFAVAAPVPADALIGVCTPSSANIDACPRSRPVVDPAAVELASAGHDCTPLPRPEAIPAWAVVSDRDGEVARLGFDQAYRLASAGQVAVERWCYR